MMANSGQQAREPQLTTPFGRLAWDLYVEEVLSRMGQLVDGMGMMVKAFLEGMEDQIIDVAETIDQGVGRSKGRPK
jgi:hypothetical protein